MRAFGPVPYSVAYRDDMTAIAAELDAAAAASTSSPALASYLRAASASFRSNDWAAAEPAWAGVTATTSPWFVRVGADDASWDPCGHKAGFHLVVARFTPDQWAARLAPLAPELEAAVAALAGAPYAAREVTLHVPEPAELVSAAGYDHRPDGAALLERHGTRSIAFTNLDRDTDARQILRVPVESVLDAAAMRAAGDGPDAGLLVTTLLEIARQLGPPPDPDHLGDPLAAVVHDAQTEAIALHLIDVLHARGVVGDELAAQSSVEAVARLLARARELFDAAGARESAPHGPAIAIGALVEAGALVWNEHGESANHSPGAFAVHVERLGAASAELIHTVAGIAARGDRVAATALAARYADEKVVPFGVLAYRARTTEPPSYVYAVIP